MTYQTAYVDDAGKVQCRSDVYGLDKDITNILHGNRQIADVPIPRNYSSSSKPVMASVPSRRETTSSRREASDSRREPRYSQEYTHYGWKGA